MDTSSNAAVLLALANRACVASAAAGVRPLLSSPSLGYESAARSAPLVVLYTDGRTWRAGTRTSLYLV